MLSQYVSPHSPHSPFLSLSLSLSLNTLAKTHTRTFFLTLSPSTKTSTLHLSDDNNLPHPPQLHPTPPTPSPASLSSWQGVYSSKNHYTPLFQNCRADILILRKTDISRCWQTVLIKLCNFLQCYTAGFNPIPRTETVWIWILFR